MPGRITSPDNDTYAYIDPQGRYKVKLNFDLQDWDRGEESLWMRLAKPYAGNTYGIHFPLIDGTEVAIAFTDGNPDRPYIAHALHDSNHPDHVATINKYRNIIRTPANNKLRMDDSRGEEHIKLASEYGKSQVNLGHLVDREKKERGHGFELRTDEWGAIAANKGLYLTSSTEAKAQGKQLDMDMAISQLENALSIAKSLKEVAQNSETEGADSEKQSQLKDSLNQLKDNGILAYGQSGIGLTSPENIQLSSSQNISLVSEKQTEISAMSHIRLAASKSLSFFAHKLGIKLFASKGKVEIQAQNDAMDIAAKEDMTISSVDGKIDLAGAKTITLISGGSYVKISDAGIELGTPKNVLVKSVAFQKMGSNNKEIPNRQLPNTDLFNQFFIIQDHETGKPMPHYPYKIEVDDKTYRGVSDEKGRTQRVFTEAQQEVQISSDFESDTKSFEVKSLNSGKQQNFK